MPAEGYEVQVTHPARSLRSFTTRWMLEREREGEVRTTLGAVLAVRSSTEDKSSSFTPAQIGGIFAGTLGSIFLLALILFCCCCARGRRDVSSPTSSAYTSPPTSPKVQAPRPTTQLEEKPPSKVPLRPNVQLVKPLVPIIPSPPPASRPAKPHPPKVSPPPASQQEKIYLPTAPPPPASQNKKIPHSAAPLRPATKHTVTFKPTIFPHQASQYKKTSPSKPAHHLGSTYPRPPTTGPIPVGSVSRPPRKSQPPRKSAPSLNTPYSYSYPRRYGTAPPHPQPFSYSSSTPLPRRSSHPQAPLYAFESMGILPEHHSHQPEPESKPEIVLNPSNKKKEWVRRRQQQPPEMSQPREPKGATHQGGLILGVGSLGRTWIRRKKKNKKRGGSKVREPVRVDVRSGGRNSDSDSRSEESSSDDSSSSSSSDEVPGPEPTIPQRVVLVDPRRVVSLYILDG